MTRAARLFPFPPPRLRAAAALLAACAAAGAARAAVVEEMLDVPVQVSDAYGKRIEQPIKVVVFDDDARPGPKPVIVINHGRAPQAADRAAMGRARFADISRWFARAGFVVAVPTRIGYGASGGEDIEDSGACGRKNFAPGFLAAAQQAVAVLQAVRERPDAARDRGVILGQSYGGATTVAAASLNPPGVVAAINFAGGSGGDPKNRPQRPCGPQLVERTYAKFGATARVPMLWVYTENDRYWGAQIPHEWFEAFQAAGGNARFVQMPPHGEDGHQLFARFPEAWKPAVAAFLREQGFDIEDRP